MSIRSQKLLVLSFLLHLVGISRTDAEKRHATTSEKNTTHTPYDDIHLRYIKSTSKTSSALLAAAKGLRRRTRFLLAQARSFTV